MSTLDAGAVAEALSTRAYGRSLEVKPRTGSTNDDAREAAAAGVASGHVIVADAQDRGRGAHGRTWASPAGTDLYFSILERRLLGPERMPWLTLAVGLGVRDALSARSPVPVWCKWPNDVLLATADGDRKSAGILVESSSVGTTVGPFVIGVGIDVNRVELAPELVGVATSLALVSGHPHDRPQVLADVLRAIEARVDQLHAGDMPGLRSDLWHHLAWRGRRVRVDDRAGILETLGDDGALVLRDGPDAWHVRSGTLRLEPV